MFSPNSSKIDKGSQGTKHRLGCQTDCFGTCVQGKICWAILMNFICMIQTNIPNRGAGFWWQRILSGISSPTVTAYPAKKLSNFLFFTYRAAFNFFSNLESNQTSIKWMFCPKKAEDQGGRRTDNRLALSSDRIFFCFLWCSSCKQRAQQHSSSTYNAWQIG